MYQLKVFTATSLLGLPHCVCAGIRHITLDFKDIISNTDDLIQDINDMAFDF